MPPARPRTAAENGFTLVELLIAATLMMLVLTASLAVLNNVERGQREVSSRNDELTQATVGTERLTREIRQASALLNPVPSSVTTAATSSTLQLKTRVLDAGVLKDTTVTYTCAGGTLTRTVNGASRVIVRNVTDDNVFTVESNTTSGANVVNYVAFSIRINSRGRIITLADGVDMRNV